MTLDPVEANRRFYAIHAQEYDDIERCLNEDAPRQRLEAALDTATAELGPGARVLDAGGGSGNASLMLCERGFDPLLVDVSPEMVDLWEQKARARGFEPSSQIAVLEEFFTSDERRWDLIVFSSVLHHLENPAAVLGAAGRRLAPGGFIVTVFDPLQLPRLSFWLLRRLDYILWVLVKSPGRVPGLVRKRLGGGDAVDVEDDFGAIAEYHAMSGLRDGELITTLTHAGVQILVRDRVYDARFSVLRWLARRMDRPTAFSLVGVRPGGDESPA